MRILQVNKYHPPHIGGVESVAKDLSETFATNECEVTTVVCHAQNRIATSEEILGRERILRGRTLATLFRLPISLEFFSLFRREVKKTDVIFLHHPFPLGFLAYVFFGQQKPLAVFYHADIVKQKQLARILNPLIQWILSRAKSIFVTSERIKNHSTVLSPYLSKCLVTPLWIDMNAFQQTQKRQEVVLTLRKKYSSPLLLAVGRLVYYKGFDVLIDAMKSIDAQLIIIGEGTESSHLQKCIIDNQLNDRIQLLPHVDDLVPYYLAADLFVFPSTESSEAFGIVQLEAMTCGLPVINTNLPTGVPEVSVHEQTGITVPPNDVIALSNAINKLLSNDELRKQYSENAKVRAALFD